MFGHQPRDLSTWGQTLFAYFIAWLGLTAGLLFCSGWTPW